MDQTNHSTVGEKKSSVWGILSLAALFVALSLFGYLGFTALNAYRNRDFSGIDIGRCLLFVRLIVAFGIGAGVCALVSFFSPRQKKALGIISMIIALLLVLTCGALLYAYDYIFGTMEQDKEFAKIGEEELYIPPVKDDGAIDFEKEQQIEIVPEEEVKQQLSLQELEWEYLSDATVPEEARPFMFAQSPLTPCYLRPGADQIENILLFGLDRAGSSDSVIILSMDRAHKKIKLISIARDSYVKIPEWGAYTKLTYAYNAGGAKTAVGTVNYNYKLNIKDYVTINFEDLSAVIDMAGGVNVDLDYDEIYYMNARGFMNLSYGMNHLNGEAAVVYSRMRHSSYKDSEETRTGRQREVLMSLYASAKEMPFNSYPDLVREAMELCRTSLDRDRILTMLMQAVSDGYTIENHALISMVDYWGGQFGPSNYFYLVYDLDAAGDTLYRLIYEDYYISGYPSY